MPKKINVKELEMDNLNDLLTKHDFTSGLLLMTMDTLAEDMDYPGADLVVYDLSKLPEKARNIQEFHNIITKHGLDEETFEIDRSTFIKTKQI